MPANSNPMPVAITANTIYQGGGLCSKSSYKGVKTSNRVPASRRESPIISSVYFFSDKVTSVLLSPLGQVLVLKTIARNQLENGTTEQIRILDGGLQSCAFCKIVCTQSCAAKSDRWDISCKLGLIAGCPADAGLSRRIRSAVLSSRRLL
jgi:hypothetical protein